MNDSVLPTSPVLRAYIVALSSSWTLWTLPVNLLFWSRSSTIRVWIRDNSYAVSEILSPVCLKSSFRLLSDGQGAWCRPRSNSMLYTFVSSRNEHPPVPWPFIFCGDDNPNMFIRSRVDGSNTFVDMFVSGSIIMMSPFLKSAALFFHLR